MGQVIRLSALFAGRARSKPRLPTRHLPELVPDPLPELVNLSTMRDAPSDWQGKPVLVMASMWWGRVQGWCPAQRKLVVMHRISGEVYFRAYDAKELRRIREDDPRA